MAELALGLTKTVVEGALSRIQWAIEEDDKLKEGVQQDLEFITGEFQMMQSFLKVANKERARNNEVARAWVRQLRDLAFDIEDWVEFVTHLEKDKSWCSCWWHLVPSCAVPQCLAPPQDLDEATAEMNLLKARVHDVSQRYTRYNLFSKDDSGSSSGLVSKAVVATGSDLSSIVFQALRQVWSNQTDRLRKVDGLPKLITSEVVGDGLQVIWLWESDDCYASELIHKAYQDEEICRSFKLCAWVKIMHPFNLQAFLNTLAAQLLSVGSSHHQATSDGLTSTAELIQHATKEQRYLIVLEQVSDLVEWNAIRKCLPDNNKGSRIVASTQNLRRAILCTTPCLVSELGCFTEGRPSICAFYQKGAGQSDSDMDKIIGKIKPGSVISVYGAPWKSRVVKRSYLSIQQNWGIFQGGFYSFKWVPLPVVFGDPFNLLDFSRRLHLNLDVCGFYDGDLKKLYDIFGGTEFEEVLCKMNEDELIESSRRILNTNCLIVIDGLRSKKHWDAVRTLLPAEPNKCCVIVVTDNERLARYCVDDNKDLLAHVRVAGMAPRLTLPPWRGRLKDISWMRSISDRHPSLSRRRLVYDRLIKDCTSNYRRAPVTSVWGISGVGKSTLVKWSCTKKVLHPETANIHMFSKYYWVDVPYPFSLVELSVRLLRAFFPDNNSEGKEIAMIKILDGQDPIQECRRLLLTLSGWLLVLDGLWSTDDWDSINEAFRLSQPNGGCKTIVVTNEQHVAMHCANKDDKQVISVQGLKADQALKFFKEQICKINIDKEPSDASDVNRVLESIMAKCGGLPKVIAAVAKHYNSMSSDKGTYMKLKDINDNFMHILEGLHNLRGLFSWMQHYLETCQDDLKPCIFYLPVFPICHDIRSRRMEMRCRAEGYFRDPFSHGADCTYQVDTDGLYTKLREFSMFQVQPSSKPTKCRINGFLHEYINSRPMEDNFVVALEGSCSMRPQRARGQHLTIRENWERDMKVFQSTDFSRLRSLTVFGQCWPWMFDPAKIKMRYVRVLDLEDAEGVTNGDLKNIVEVFPRLKFLSLRGCGKITRLPKSLGRLRQLETLDIRHTPVATLPKAILKLQKLQYVRAGNIHTARWDEGGIMVPYQTTTPGEIISTAVTLEDGTTSAAAPSTPAEGASTPSATTSDSEDTTIYETIPSATQSDSEYTTIIETPPPSPEEVPTTFATAPPSPAEDASSTLSAIASDSEDTTIFETPPLSPAEVAMTFVAAPLCPPEIGATVAGALLAQTVTASLLAPDEDARTATTSSSALEEDTRIVLEDLIASAQGTTTVPVAPFALVEDSKVVADLTALAEDPTIVAPTLSTRAEDTTSLAAQPMAAVEESIIVAPVPSTLPEGATIVAVGRPALSEYVTSVAAAPMAPSEDSSTPAAAPRSRPHALIPSWLSKLTVLINTIDGVVAPAGIAKLTSLHTFGVANVGPGKNSVILKELHKLKLLQRISVCGINPDNIHQFFDAIQGLNHLVQLTVRLDKNWDGLFPFLDETIVPPPKTVENLRLLGHVRILQGCWIKEFADVRNLDLEVTIQDEDDMQVILDHLIHRNGYMKRLCIKPIQDGELRIGINDENKDIGFELRVLEIVCTTNLQATFGNIGDVDVLRVECSSGSLKLSGLQAIGWLDEVWLKGSCCSDTLKQDLQRQLDQYQGKTRPVLKVLQQRPS